MQRIDDMTPKQQIIVHNSSLVQFALIAGVIAALIGHQGIRALYLGEPSTTAASLALALCIGAAWHAFYKWRRELMRCDTCQASLFRPFLFQVSVGFWTWYYNVPKECHACGTRFA